MKAKAREVLTLLAACVALVAGSYALLEGLLILRGV